MPKLLSVLFVTGTIFLTSSVAQISLHQESAVVPHQVDGSMALLYDQTSGGNNNGYSSQDFEAAFATYDCQAADDFVVPAPGWTIDQVVVSGQYTSGPADGFNIYFYSDNGGIPGAQVYFGAGQPFTFNGSDLFTINLTLPPVLTPGIYWVSVQCRMDYNVGGQWYWNQINGTAGIDTQWQNPLGGFGTSCSSWGSIQTCISAVGTAQYFALYGITVPVEVEIDDQAPAVFALEQNYPNPFNPTTTIGFSLATDSKVSLKIFNALGQEVKSIVNGNLTSGFHELAFDASEFNSGVYFYRIDATGIDGQNFTQVRKMILAK